MGCAASMISARKMQVDIILIMHREQHELAALSVRCIVLRHLRNRAAYHFADIWHCTGIVLAVQSLAAARCQHSPDQLAVLYGTNTCRAQASPAQVGMSALHCCRFSPQGSSSYPKTRYLLGQNSELNG